MLFFSPKLVEMQIFNGKTICFLVLIIPIVLPSKNETDHKSTSKHPYSNLWFFQRLIGLIGIFLNILGKFTIRILQKIEQFAFSSTLFPILNFAKNGSKWSVIPNIKKSLPFEPKKLAFKIIHRRFSLESVEYTLLE